MSTAVEVLEELALTHDLPRLVLEWRALQKLKGTYIDALPQMVHPQTGRVHTCFNQAVAATGRLSSSDPNLQNIPIRTELGREIRRAFVADPGHVLISADYSQIELRVLAHLSEDETLIAAFQRGDDIHDQTALKVFGPESGLDPHELRRRAKIINYALLYGKTAFTLAKDIGVTQQAAQAFIDAVLRRLPARARVHRPDDRRRARDDRRRQDDVRAPAARARADEPQRPGAVGGRTRHRQHADPGHGRRHPEARHDRRARGHRARCPGRSGPAGRMILTVHDELLFEVPRERADELAVVIREQMEQAATLAVPLTVDVGIGENWKDSEELNPECDIRTADGRLQAAGLSGPGSSGAGRSGHRPWVEVRAS